MQQQGCVLCCTDATSVYPGDDLRAQLGKEGSSRTPQQISGCLCPRCITQRPCSPAGRCSPPGGCGNGLRPAPPSGRSSSAPRGARSRQPGGAAVRAAEAGRGRGAHAGGARQRGGPRSHSPPQHRSARDSSRRRPGNALLLRPRSAPRRFPPQRRGRGGARRLTPFSPGGCLLACSSEAVTAPSPPRSSQRRPAVPAGLSGLSAEEGTHLPATSPQLPGARKAPRWKGKVGRSGGAAAEGPQWPGWVRGSGPEQPSRAQALCRVHCSTGGDAGPGRRFPARPSGWDSVSCVVEYGEGWAVCFFFKKIICFPLG